MKGRYETELWAQLADEARAAAKRIKDPDLRLRVLLVAARYLIWAKKSARTLHRSNKPGGSGKQNAAPRG
jgi:hypothetical protein